MQGDDEEKRKAFSTCFTVFQQRISELVSLMQTDGGADVIELMQRVALNDVECQDESIGVLV